MKRILLKIALFFSLLILPFLVMIVAPYSEKFAFHYIEKDCYNHGAWIYDRIVQNPTPADVAFIGSSHILHAIQEKKIEELSGTGSHMVNLGYCRYGRNLEYVVLSLLLKHKSPKLVVIEVHEEEEKDSHDIFPYLASTRDLFLSPTLFNRDYFSDLFYGMSARLEQFKSCCIFRKDYGEPGTERYGYASSDRTSTEEELKENETEWTKRLSRNEDKTIEKLQAKYPLAYLNKTIRLLNEKKIPFLFIYLPEYGSALKSPKYAAYYQNKAPLLIPPQHILNDASNWMDAGHFNDKGSGLLSEWMAEQLKSELCIEHPN